MPKVKGGEIYRSGSTEKEYRFENADLSYAIDKDEKEIVFWAQIDSKGGGKTDVKFTILLDFLSDFSTQAQKLFGPEKQFAVDLLRAASREIAR